MTINSGRATEFPPLERLSRQLIHVIPDESCPQVEWECAEVSECLVVITAAAPAASSASVKCSSHVT